MENLGAGLAALGVIGPGIGIGILAGMSASAIGRNPDAAGQIRGLAIILAAFAEGLGVLAVVVGLLAIFIKLRRSRHETTPVDILALVGEATRQVACQRRRKAAAGVPDQPVLGDRQRRQLHRLLPDRQSLAFKGLTKTLDDPPLAHRAGPQGRGAGPHRSRVRRAGAAGRPHGGPSRGERDHQPRPEGGVGDPRGGHRRHPRRAGPDARARRRRDRDGEAAGHRRAPWRGHRPRARGRRPGRRRRR